MAMHLNNLYLYMNMEKTKKLESTNLIHGFHTLQKQLKNGIRMSL